MEGLGNNQRSKFIGIANGKVTYRPSKDAERQEFDYVEGHIQKITKRDATINGEKVPFYDILIKTTNDSFVLSVPAENGISRSIINSLMSIQDFAGKVVRINPYVKTVGESVYTNVAVRVNGEKVDWAKADMPKPKQVRVGSKVLNDYSEIDEIIEGFVAEINTRLAAANGGNDGSPVVDYESDNDPRYAPEPGDDLPAGDAFLNNGK